jgi:nucleoside-diphosphate-sugar epimerase
MKILITGADGFIGKNLIFALRSQGYQDLLLFGTDAPTELLERYCAECGFVYHLAGARLHFASEIKALFTDARVPRRIDIARHWHEHHPPSAKPE